MKSRLILALVTAASLVHPALGSSIIPSGSVSAQKLGSTSITGPTNYSISTAVGSSQLTITLKDQAGNTPSAVTPVKVNFTAATSSGSALRTAVSVTSATSLVVSSGATLGCKSATACRFYVYALNNAGTLELAVSQTKEWDEGIAQSSTTMSGGAISATTLYSTTGRSSVFIRLLAVITATETVAGTWATLPATIGYEGSVRYSGRSYAVLDTFTTGCGSTNTKAIKFSNATVVGTAVSATANSSTLGHIITINEPGLYCASLYMRPSTNTEEFIGISLNSNGATAIQSLSVSAVLCKALHAQIASTSGPMGCSWCGWLDATDSLLAHSQACGFTGAAADNKITVTKMLGQ